LLSQISQNDLGWLLLPFLGRICWIESSYILIQLVGLSNIHREIWGFHFVFGEVAEIRWGGINVKGVHEGLNDKKKKVLGTYCLLVALL
jgi:hypothetical protein